MTWLPSTRPRLSQAHHQQVEHHRLAATQTYLTDLKKNKDASFALSLPSALLTLISYLFFFSMYS